MAGTVVYNPDGSTTTTNYDNNVGGGCYYDWTGPGSYSGSVDSLGFWDGLSPVSTTGIPADSFAGFVAPVPASFSDGSPDFPYQVTGTAEDAAIAQVTGGAAMETQGLSDTGGGSTSSLSPNQDPMAGTFSSFGDNVTGNTSPAAPGTTPTDADGFTATIAPSAMAAGGVTTAPAGQPAGLTATTSGPNSQAHVSILADADGGITHFSFDTYGNLASLTDPDGNTTTWSYNSQNQITQETDAQGNIDSFTYNSSDQLASYTDKDGSVRTYQYLCSCQPGGTDFLRPSGECLSKGSGLFSFSHKSMAA